jgi:hypothetical protein
MGQMKFRFKPWQFIFCVIQYAGCVALAIHGHPYLGVALAMIHLEYNN